MEIKRYFIIRVDGVDWGVTDDGAKAAECLEMLKTRCCTELTVEMNALTTTYYMNTNLIAE